MKNKRAVQYRTNLTPFLQFLKEIQPHYDRLPGVFHGGGRVNHSESE